MGLAPRAGEGAASGDRCLEKRVGSRRGCVRRLAWDVVLRVPLSDPSGRERASVGGSNGCDVLREGGVVRSGCHCFRGVTFGGVEWRKK